jgi:FkbM family methyltransferase
VKRALYRLGPVSRGLRSALNSAASQGLSHVTVAGGELAGAKLLLDMQTEKDYWLGTYEMNLQQVIRDWVKPGMVAYDVGANIGYVSLLLAKRVGENGQVLSFEPLPANQDRLQKNVALNPNMNVRLISKAVSEKEGETTFLVHASGGMGKLQGFAGQKADYENKIQVETVSLDGFVYKEKNAVPNIIKIDIEGGEVQALKGMPRLFKEAKPILLIELHGHEAAEDTLAILHKAGYNLYFMRSGYQKIVVPKDLGKKSYVVARAD